METTRMSLLALLVLVLITQTGCWRTLTSLRQRRRESCISCASSGELGSKVQQELQTLQEYNDLYLKRMKAGREAGKSPQLIEFERAQLVQAEGLRQEREALKAATIGVSAVAKEVTLGIKAETGVRALEVLKRWVTGLSLDRGVLRAVDENNVEVSIDRWNEMEVYIKYNSTERGDAYMKPYTGGLHGVIFQPKLPDNEFRQYGDFPLSTF